MTRREGEKASGSQGERDSLTILGVRIDCVDFPQTLAWVASQVTEQSRNPQSLTHPIPTRQLCTVNPEFIMHARRDPTFATVLHKADLCVPDGVGVLWAARRQGVTLPERVTGSDGIYRICEQAAAKGWTVFLLGAAPGVAELAATNLRRKYPQLTVVGTYSGSPAEAEWPAIQAQLVATKPDILFVAYGHPQQDRWIAHHRHELPVKVALGVGAAVDFAAGITTRAPRWMQRLGVEWLHRLLTQPWRWRRMLVLPWFVWLVLTEN